MIATVLGWFGFHPSAVGPAIAAFAESLWRSAMTLVVAYLATALANNMLATPGTALLWLHHIWWPFLVALLVVPLAQGGHKAHTVSAQAAAGRPANGDST